MENIVKIKKILLLGFYSFILMSACQSAPFVSAPIEFVALVHDKGDQFFRAWYNQLQNYSQEELEQEMLAMTLRERGLYNRTVPTRKDLDACYNRAYGEDPSHDCKQCITCRILKKARSPVANRKEVEHYFDDVTLLMNEFYRSIAYIFIEKHCYKLHEEPYPIKGKRPEKVIQYKLRNGVVVDKDVYDHVYKSLTSCDETDLMLLMYGAIEIIVHENRIKELLKPYLDYANLFDEWTLPCISYKQYFPEFNYNPFINGIVVTAIFKNIDFSNQMVKNSIKNMVYITDIERASYNYEKIEDMVKYWVYATAKYVCENEQECIKHIFAQVGTR